MKKGFTLIELLVVVLIIGILSAVAMPQYTKAVEKARAAEAFVILKDIWQKQQLYHLATGSNDFCANTNEEVGIEYPADFECFGDPLTSTIGGMCCSKNWCFLKHGEDSGGGTCALGFASAWRINNAQEEGPEGEVLYQIDINPDGSFDCLRSTNYCKMLNL